MAALAPGSGAWFRDQNYPPDVSERFAVISGFHAGLGEWLGEAICRHCALPQQGGARGPPMAAQLVTRQLLAGLTGQVSEGVDLPPFDTDSAADRNAAGRSLLAALKIALAVPEALNAGLDAVVFPHMMSLLHWCTFPPPGAGGPKIDQAAAMAAACAVAVKEALPAHDAESKMVDHSFVNRGKVYLVGVLNHDVVNTDFVSRINLAHLFKAVKKFTFPVDAPVPPKVAKTYGPSAYAVTREKPRYEMGDDGAMFQAVQDEEDKDGGTSPLAVSDATTVYVNSLIMVTNPAEIPGIAIAPGGCVGAGAHYCDPQVLVAFMKLVTHMGVKQVNQKTKTMTYESYAAAVAWVFGEIQKLVDQPWDGSGRDDLVPGSAYAHTFTEAFKMGSAKFRQRCERMEECRVEVLATAAMGKERQTAKKPEKETDVDTAKMKGKERQSDPTHPRNRPPGMSRNQWNRGVWRGGPRGRGAPRGMDRGAHRGNPGRVRWEDGRDSDRDRWDMDERDGQDDRGGWYRGGVRHPSGPRDWTPPPPTRGGYRR